MSSTDLKPADFLKGCLFLAGVFIISICLRFFVGTLLYG